MNPLGADALGHHRPVIAAPETPRHLKAKRAALQRPLGRLSNLLLQRGFDFEAPGFQKRLGDVFGVLVAASPLAQTGRAQILVWSEFVLAHNLLKLRNGRDNWADGLGLAPVRISATLRHETCLSYNGGITKILLCI